MAKKLTFEEIIKKESERWKNDTYTVEFAPDGKHFQEIRAGHSVERMWDFFTQNPEITTQKMLNPFSKFRLRNLTTGKIIGEK